MRVSVLIPAYKPGLPLLQVIAALAATDIPAIIVVNDGSGPEFQGVFQQAAALPRVHLLQHAVNLGKGAALKTGMNYALCAFPDHIGLVTADADGQHHPEDILKVAHRLETKPRALVLGVRQFSGDVPLRSRLGNQLTREAVRLVVGQNLSDTQTGLRGVPRALMLKLLKVSSVGYDFELDMLVTSKHHSYELVEETIRTIYEDGNRSSHFNPLIDSMKIYFVLLRFGLLSFSTAILDNVVFYVLFRFTGSVLESQIAARVASVAYNYGVARKSVFLSDQQHQVTLPKYLLLVLCSGTLSYASIQLLTSLTSLSVFGAKITAESFLFLVNFAIQRDFVFTRRRDERFASE
jgi:glycosyltransferase involved in cell wall biosynthesis